MSAGGRKRFWRAVAAGFVAGLVVIAIVAATRDDDKPDPGPRLKEIRLKPKPVKATPPTDAKGCTDIWVGKTENEAWTNARNWSTGHLPGPRDHVCIGPGTVVTLAAAKVQVASIRDEGTLYLIAGARLAPRDLISHSKIAGLVLSGGTLGGDATVEIHALSWQEGGAMVDAGETLLPRGSRGTFTGGRQGSGVVGPKRQLRINGDFSVVSGALYLDTHADVLATKTAHLHVNDVSVSGEPAGVLTRETGRPVKMRYRGRIVEIGAPGRHPHPGPDVG